MRKRYKMGLVLISIITIVLIFLVLLKSCSKKEEKPKNTTNVISNIESFGYSLEDRDTKYMKDTFEELAKVLDQEEINEEEYAKTLSKLFIIDFYTLNNKINKYDVGSLEFVLSSKKESFKNKAMDTMYKDIIDNTYKDRIQDLPEIVNVEIKSVEKAQYKLEKEELEALQVVVNFEYKEDLGYDNSGTITLIKNDQKLEVVNFTPTHEKE